MPTKKTIDEIIDDYKWRLDQIPTWTREKHQVMEEFVDQLHKAGYGYFHASPNNCFNLTGLGNSTVQTIPKNKRGNLKYWRGETIRIVCVGSGRYTRGYVAGPTKRRPSDATI